MTQPEVTQREVVRDVVYCTATTQDQCRQTDQIYQEKKDVSVGEVSTRFGKGVKMGNVSSSSSTSNSDDVIWNQTLTRLKLEAIHNVISPLDVAVSHCMHTKTNQLPVGA